MADDSLSWTHLIHGFCVARLNALEISWRVPPVETDLGQSMNSGRRIGLSTVFGGARYPHESAQKSRSVKSHAWIGDLCLLCVIDPQGKLPLLTSVRDRSG